MTVVGAILDGGSSRRMGTRKDLLRLADGRTMIEAVADALGAVTDSLVVLGPEAVLDGVPHVPDRRAGLGPLAGIDALLADGDADAYLVCPCDVPLVTPDLLRRLLDAPGDAAVYAVEGEARRRPLPARLPRRAAAIAARHLDEGTLAVGALIDALGATTVALTRAEGARLANVNEPSDLRRLESSP